MAVVTRCVRFLVAKVREWNALAKGLIYETQLNSQQLHTPFKFSFLYQKQEQKCHSL